MTTNAEQRNFATFELGDNVNELAGGVVPQMAKELGIKVSGEPSSDDLQSILNQIGTNKEKRLNPDIEIDRDTKIAFVEAAGTQIALNRSLWTPEATATPDTVDGIFVVTSVANWLDRAVAAIPEEFAGMPVQILGGQRTMSGPTEKVNQPNVAALQDKLGRFPTEAEYAEHIAVPALEARGLKPLLNSYDSTNGDELLRLLFEEKPELAEQKTVIVRNANAGIISAFQLRDAARKINAGFDTDPSDPQIFVITDDRELARTDEQEADAQNYQKVDPALNQMLVAAKKIHEAGSN